MSSFDCVIRGGTIATAQSVGRADVGIVDGVIAEVGPDLSAGAEEIDATGMLVLPGGVDTHVHVEQDIGRAVSADTFDSATRSAAIGGTTTIICFAAQERGGSLTETVEDYHERAARSRIDYAFHLMVTDPRPEVIDGELPALVAAGNRSIKIFLANPVARLSDAEALKVLAAARRLGAMVCVHAEHHELMDFHIAALARAGMTRPIHHAWSRPLAIEREAIHRVLTMAEVLDVPVQIFHLTGGESVDEVARFRARGRKVWAETCPQYLLLSADDLDRPDFEGAKFVCGPPLRDAREHEDLWRGLADGRIDNVSSDHSPIRFDGPRGKKVAGEDAPFTEIPKGLPGVGSRMPLLFSEGVQSGRIDLKRFVAVTATNPARIFGLERKGTIEQGFDADIVLWDPERRVSLTNAMLQHGCDYTPYEGRELKGWPVLTMLRGRVIAREGRMAGRPGGGRFIARAPYAAIEPAGDLPTPFDPVTGTMAGRQTTGNTGHA